MVQVGGQQGQFRVTLSPSFITVPGRAFNSVVGVQREIAGQVVHV